MDTDDRPRRPLLTGVALAAAALLAGAAPRAAADTRAAAAPRAGADTSFVPIPEIIVDPNEGNTYGIMGVWLFLNERDEIQYMLAPDLRYNETKGVFPTIRLFGYPTETRRYSVAIGKSTTKDQSYEVNFLERAFMMGDQRTFLAATLSYEQDSTERFYGFGNDSDEDDESNYTSEDFDAQVTPGVWIRQHVALSYRTQVRRFAISRGQVDDVPYILAPRFVRNPETDIVGRGSDPGVYWSHRLAVTYDTRDSIDMPTGGAFSNLYVEVADRRLGSATSYVKFGGEGKGFIPFRGARKNPVLALRVLADYVSGGQDTPFWQMSSLGGRRALRGYGGDRFIDFNRALAGAELRTRVYGRRILGVMAELELAPYVEAGQVFRDVSDSPVDDLHWVYGLGFRGLVRPQIVAFVDVGYGDEGTAIFTGIDYPF